MAIFGDAVLIALISAATLPGLPRRSHLMADTRSKRVAPERLDFTQPSLTSSRRRTNIAQCNRARSVFLAE